MLQQLGIKVQKFELSKILEQHDRNKDGHMNKEEFEDVRKIKIEGFSLIVYCKY
jgi:Ca2+-binding EF-hand superfamily protein